MFLLFNDTPNFHGLPEKNSILKITPPPQNPSTDLTAEGIRQNSIKCMDKEGESKIIWIICRFDVLRKGGGKIGSPTKIETTKFQIEAEEHTTPNQSKQHRLKAPPQNAPFKKREGSDDESPNDASSAKRALFSTPRTSNANLFQTRTYQPSHLIKNLNPYQNKFRIKARVIKKSQMRRWSNSRGEGMVFDVTLQDSSGDIRATGKIFTTRLSTGGRQIRNK